MQPVNSGGITRLIQQKRNAAGTRIFGILNEFLRHIIFITVSAINHELQAQISHHIKMLCRPVLRAH